jgi:hypothetical protein
MAQNALTFHNAEKEEKSKIVSVQAMYMTGGLTCHLLPKLELKYSQFTFPIPNISTATYKLPLTFMNRAPYI